MIKKIFLLIAALLLLNTVNAYSKTYKEIPYKTIYYGLKNVQGYDKTSSNFSCDLPVKLKQIKNLSLESSNCRYNEKEWKNLCFSMNCLKGKNKEKINRIIYGIINYEIIEVKDKSDIENEDIKKYLKEVETSIKYKYYTVTVKIQDLDNDKQLAELNIKFAEYQYKEKIEEIKNMISKYYTAGFLYEVPEIGKRKWDFPDAAFTGGSLKKTEYKKQNLKFSLNISATAIFSSGLYQSIAENAYGFTIAAELSNVFFDNFYLQLSIPVLFADVKNININTYTLFPITLHAGYSFKPLSWLSLSPQLGFGYHIHLLKEYWTGAYRAFFDPALSLGFRVSFYINERFSIFITPGYNFFFEQQMVGNYFIIDLGVKFSF